MNYSVYKHTSPSGKVYIGITGGDVNIRWMKGYGKQTIFGKAIRKYGWNNFKHEVLFTNLSKEKAESFEIRLIFFYKNILRKSYNDANGGNLAGKMSEETKNRIRLKALGHKRNLGHKLSDDTKNKIRLKHLNKNISEATKEKLRNHPNIKGNTNKRKPLYQYDLSGNLLNVFSNSYEAQLETGVNRCNISACCNGRLSHAGKFVWSYGIKTD